MKLTKKKLFCRSESVSSYVVGRHFEAAHRMVPVTQVPIRPAPHITRTPSKTSFEGRDRRGDVGDVPEGSEEEKLCLQNVAAYVIIFR